MFQESFRLPVSADEAAAGWGFLENQPVSCFGLLLGI
jgi:hypothetical protein